MPQATAQVSRRKFGFVGRGGTSTNILDSPFLTRGFTSGVPASLHYNSPYFDANGVPAGSFTVSLPITRFQKSQRDMIAAVREAGVIATNLLRTGRLAVPVPAMPRQRPAEDPK